MASSPMLRDFATEPDIYLLKDLFLDFQFEPDETFSGPMMLLWFQILTPDSFAWKVAYGGHIYMLYAEDYIKSFEYVQQEMAELNDGYALEFKKIYNAQQFATSSPVRHATTYKRPVDAKTMMEYAATSGFDFVFLARSIEPYEDVFFSKKHNS